MKRINLKIVFIMLCVILFSCGIQSSSPPPPTNFDIELKYTCTKYQGSVKIVVLSYDKNPRLFTSHYKEDTYKLSPDNILEKDNYDYSSYAILVIGKDDNAFLVTDSSSVQMQNDQFITVKIVRYPTSNKTVPIKSVLIQD